MKAEFIGVEGVMAKTTLPRATAYALMDKVAALAGLDLTARVTRAKLLPIATWEAYSKELLAPTAEARPNTPPRIATPPRATPRATVDAAPAVPLTTPRKHRPRTLHA